MRCLNPRCTRELADDWAFCDRCGKDNRPPRLRTSVVEDDHLAPAGEFCVRCGVSILDVNDDAEEENRLWVIGGWAAFLVGGVSLAISAALRPALLANKADGESRGTSIAFVAARYGSYLFAAGIVLLLATLAVRRRRRP